MALHGGFCYKNKNSVPGASPDPSLQLTQSICIKPSHATLSMLPHNHLHGVCPFIGLPWWLSGKESACTAGDLGSIPGLGRFSGLGRSSGEGNGYLLHYCGLENSMDCIVHGVANNRTRLSDFHFDFVNVLQLLLSTTLWYTTGISAVCYCKITQNLWWYSSVQVWLSIKQLQITHPYDKLLTMVRVGLHSSEDGFKSQMK